MISFGGPAMHASVIAIIGIINKNKNQTAIFKIKNK